jgi:hypothetical protein
MSMRFPRFLPVATAAAVAAIGCSVALSGTAFADATVSATIGPVTIPSVPASVCVKAPGVDKCISLPAAKSVTLKVTAAALKPGVAVTPPSITKIACPAGTSGAAAEVSSGSAAVLAGGSATIALSGKPSITVPVVPAVVAPGKTAKVYACTGTS